MARRVDCVPNLPKSRDKPSTTGTCQGDAAARGAIGAPAELTGRRLVDIALTYIAQETETGQTVDCSVTAATHQMFDLSLYCAYRMRWCRGKQEGRRGTACSVGLRICIVHNEPLWVAGCMGFVWMHADSFLHSVASPFYSFVTIALGTCVRNAPSTGQRGRCRIASRRTRRTRGLACNRLLRRWRPRSQRCS